MRVLGISGSLRRDSYNSGLLRAAADLLPSGATLEVFDGLKAIPPYDADDDVEPAPAPVQALREAIAGADAVLIATPEYNASIPGVLKNALDWASRPHATNPLRGKPAAVIGASTGMFGAVWAQADARKILSDDRRPRGRPRAAGARGRRALRRRRHAPRPRGRGSAQRTAGRPRRGRRGPRGRPRARAPPNLPAALESSSPAEQPLVVDFGGRLGGVALARL